MTHYYEIENQRENEFDGLLSIEDIVNIKPNKKKVKWNQINQILSEATNNFLIISLACVKSIRIFLPNFPMALH